MKKSILLVAVLAMSEPVFAFTLESLTQQQVTDAFVNKTATSIATDDFNGQLASRRFTMYLDDKGNITGKVGFAIKNEPQTDTGIYTIAKDGSIYATWKHWYNRKKVCFHIYNTENTYISVDCDNVFHTAYMKNAIKPGNQITP